MKAWQQAYPQRKLDHQLPQTEVWLLMWTSSAYLDLPASLGAPLISPSSSYSTYCSDSVTAASLGAAGVAPSGATPYLSSSICSCSLRFLSASSLRRRRSNSPAVGLACRCCVV